MNEKIDESLKDLLLPLDDLVPLEGNPRRGNVDAIVASYREFGQLKPIVVRPNDNSTYTVIAGNHQVEAARRLGWGNIAAVQMLVDESKAIAFALADNRTTELGYSDSSDVFELMQTINNDYKDLFDGLEWDELEVASLEESSYLSSGAGASSTEFTPPAITNPNPVELQVEHRSEEEGGSRIVAGDEVDHKAVAVQGSTVAVPGAAPQAVVQYTLVFDDAEQQRRWYDFIRWLRNDPGYEGDTTAQKIVSFIDAHSEV